MLQKSYFTLLNKLLLQLGVSNPDDIVSWYPHEMTSISSQHSKQQDLTYSINDELKHLHNENLKKVNIVVYFTHNFLLYLKLFLEIISLIKLSCFLVRKLEIFLHLNWII